MTVSPYASEAKISEALTAIGAELIGQTEQQLLQQILVAAATASGAVDPLSLIASQEQAEAGTANDVLMTPLRTKEAIVSRGLTPIVIAFKNITVLTTGAPADVASITLPSWLTRWRLAPSGMAFCEANTASGTLAGATFQIHAVANGAASAVSSNFLGPANTSSIVLVTASGTTTLPSNTTTIYLRQTTNSANAGTVSVFLTLLPCL